MREEGIVKSVSGGLCEVGVKRKSACGENCVSCGAGCAQTEHICTCRNLAAAKPGDRVFVEMDTSRVLKSAFFVYILPLFAFLTLFCAMQYCKAGAFVSAACATAGGVLSFFGVSLYTKRRKNDFLPSVTEII